MMFAGQTALDASILAFATTFTLITIAHVVMLWSIRRNFFILLRSPLLTCMFGLFIVVRYNAKAYEYVVNWRGDGTGKYGTAALLGYPALLTALVALVMTAVRLLVMYYPSQRARWGRYVKEAVLIRALGCALVLMEVGVWSAAWWFGISRTATAAAMVVQPLSFAATLLASTWLVCQLRNVHDSTNLGRDIALVGRALVVTLLLFAAFQVIPMSPDVSKYAKIFFISVANIPVVYLINIRPVREVLRHVPPGRRTIVQKLLAPRHRRTPVQDDGCERAATSQGRAVCVDENRLATIMTFPTLKTAFGEFCRRSLCSESFEFLVDVADFKTFDRGDDGGVGNEISLDFAKFLGIVSTYIKYDSHLEINIGENLKRDIMDYTKFEAYLLLGPRERKDVFNGAEAEISSLLADNLLSKFLASAQYTEVVDLEIA